MESYFSMKQTLDNVLLWDLGICMPLSSHEQASSICDRIAKRMYMSTSPMDDIDGK